MYAHFVSIKSTSVHSFQMGLNVYSTSKLRIDLAAGIKWQAEGGMKLLEWTRQLPSGLTDSFERGKAAMDPAFVQFMQEIVVN